MDLGVLIDDFGFKLLAILSEVGPLHTNYVASSSSIYLVLVMILIGAKHKTADELSTLLKMNFSVLLPRTCVTKSEEEEIQTLKDILIKLVKSSSEVSKIANKIFVENELSKDYEIVIKSLLSTEVDKISFKNVEKACLVINEWVKDQTEGRIEKILTTDDISADTTYVVVNTIFFKSNWRRKFSAEITFQDDFHVSSTETVKVMMMKGRGKQKALYWFSPEANYSVLMMPFESDHIYGVYVLPEKNNNVADILTSIKGEHIRKWFIDSSEEELFIKVPRMKISKLFSIKDVLMKLGVVEVFEPNFADLSGISKERSFLSNVFHSASIELDEEGVVAAAATAAVANFRSSFQPKTISFHVNRPFIFLIYDTKTKVSFFVSLIHNPNLK